MSSYFLAIDQGTTSSRAIIYNQKFEKVSVGQKEFPQYFPKPGWVEHSLTEIWGSVEHSIKSAIKNCSDRKFSKEKIKFIGITNQRETFSVWDSTKKNQKEKAIVWQCNRSSDLCEKFKKNTKAKKIAVSSGLLLDPYFSGTKLHWLLNKDKRFSKNISTKYKFGTIDTYLIWKLTNHKSHFTDTSNASRTLLMNLKTLKWNKDALSFFKIPQFLLPEIKNSNANFGVTQGLKYLPDGIPITGVLGDQQAALFGQGAFEEGSSKCTFGTGAFLLVNSGSKVQRIKNTLSTVAWTINNKTTYANEGSVFIAGAAFQWLRDNLKIIKKSSEIEQLAKKSKCSEGVFFIPAFSGLGSPYWNSKVNATIGGLTRGSNNSHIAHASLEGVAHSICDLYGLLTKSFNKKTAKLFVDGGACLNDYLMSIQSTLLDTQVIRRKDVESTARGAIYMAAIGSNYVRDKKKLLKFNPISKRFNPSKKLQENLLSRKNWNWLVKTSSKIYK